ncbi:MAG: imidazoleglycerol-phosphate dehydratase HisB [Myxococcota bacterium]|nr:imidazoleglycerol-phosphate dehydratase HisB [Myxococcota bacterium]
MSENSENGRERRSAIERNTKETQIRVEIALDGSGVYEIDTGVAFFDHMLESFSRHALFDLKIKARGDLDVDTHHTIEDVGIVMGQAFREALGSAVGIRRFGQMTLPMAESKVEVTVDVSNRPFLLYQVDLVNDRIGSFDATLTEDFLQALSQNAGLDLHVELRYGRNPHHVVEAIFKGLARALRAAVEMDPKQSGLPTVKGAL